MCVNKTLFAFHSFLTRPRLGLCFVFGRPRLVRWSGNEFGRKGIGVVLFGHQTTITPHLVCSSNVHICCPRWCLWQGKSVKCDGFSLLLCVTRQRTSARFSDHDRVVVVAVNILSWIPFALYSVLFESKKHNKITKHQTQVAVLPFLTCHRERF